MSSPPTDLVVVGRVGRAHGLQGAFFLSDRLEQLPKSYRELWIGADARTAARVDLAASGMQAGRPLVRLVGVPDRTAAELLTGQLVFVERRRIRDAARNELTWSDLEGREVVGSDDKLLGKVVGLYNSGSSDVMTVVRADGQSVDLPLSPPYFDVDAGSSALEKDGPVRLLVASDCFDELWQPR